MRLELHNLLLQNNTPSLSEFHISEKDVIDSICNLQPNKAAGPDEISPQMIKEAGLVLLLCHHLQDYLIFLLNPENFHVSGIGPM